MSGSLRSIDDHLPAPALFSHPGHAAHPSLDILIIVSDRALATRCVAVLKAAGFDFAADFVSTWVDLQKRLRSKQYGLIIGEPELAPGRGGKLLESLKRNAFDAPFIQLSEHPNPEPAEQPAPSCIADYLSTRELARLPLVVARALEAKRRQDETEWANRAQRLAQERYQSLFEQDVVGVYRVALDGQILDLNQLGARILGYATCEDARTHRLQESASREEDIEYLLTSVQEKKLVDRFEIDLRRRDGQPIRALASASLVDQGPDSPPAIEGILFDSTSWKRAEEAVRLDEHRFRTLLEKSSDAISLVDSSGHVIYSSHAVSPILGYELDERIGKSVFELVHPEDAPQVLLVFQKVVSRPFSSLSIQLRYRHKNGSWRWIEALGTNLLEDPGVGAIVINYRDVTEQRGLQEQLFQAQKMEAVGRLAGGVAHDFNNLLTAILGYSDMVLEKLPAHSALRRYTDQIKKAGERAASLTRQLLAFSRLQVMAPQVLDLNAAVSDMGGMLRRVIGENIKLSVMAAPTLARVKADPSQVEQVILNLAVNARDAMPQGGELTIQTSNSVVEESFVRDRVLVQAGNYVRIEVSDTGCGMDSEIQAHAFEPFFTTKEKGKGTGLGLSTVYGIVKQSGGYLWVSS
ncbi:MAG: PAS domain S-box protein, partial [Terriglobia bacterium]